MRPLSVTTNTTARAFQLAALLVVGAFVLLILAYELVNGPVRITYTSKPGSVERTESAPHTAVP
jgi:hypothetical protein